MFKYKHWTGAKHAATDGSASGDGFTSLKMFLIVKAKLYKCVKNCYGESVEDAVFRNECLKHKRVGVSR